MLLPMATVPVMFLITGLVLRKLPRSERGVRLSTALCSVALFWFTCAMVSGIPFMLGLHMGFTDALFEGMAGWTGTAFTMIPALDTAPRTLLFWRSFMQWIGGIGIIAFTIALASNTGLSSSKIFRTEGRDEPLMPGVIATGTGTLEDLRSPHVFCHRSHPVYRPFAVGIGQPCPCRHLNGGVYPA